MIPQAQQSRGGQSQNGQEDEWKEGKVPWCSQGSIVGQEPGARQESDTHSGKQAFKDAAAVPQELGDTLAGVQTLIHGAIKAQFERDHQSRDNQSPAAHRRAQNVDAHDRQDAKESYKDNDTDDPLFLAS